MKILKRNYTHRNVLLFLLFTIFYLHSLDCLAHGISIIDVASVGSIGLTHVFLWGLILVTFFMVYFVRKHSELFLLTTIAIVSLKNFLLLTYSFNKLILLLDFVYLLFAFYFYISWELEIKRACFRPNFSKSDLEKETRVILDGMLKVGEETRLAHVSNLDETGCFIILNEKLNASDLKNLLNSSDIWLSTIVEDIEFKQKVRVSAQYDRGIGLEYLEENSSDLAYDYLSLYKICLERGYFI